MLCELCLENDASVHLTQVIDGVVKKLHCCQDCAVQSGLNVDSALSLTDVLFGIGAPEESDAGLGGKSCPFCHMRRSDFRKTSRLGCPACYETFAGELDGLLVGMHNGREHAGKVPKCAARAPGVSVRTVELQAQLEQAVAEEKYEEAARLRDLIRNLRSPDGAALPASATGGQG